VIGVREDGVKELLAVEDGYSDIALHAGAVSAFRRGPVGPSASWGTGRENLAVTPS